MSDGAELVCGNIEKLFEEARQRTKIQQDKWIKYYKRRRRETKVLTRCEFITREIEVRVMMRRSGSHRNAGFREAHGIFEVREDQTREKAINGEQSQGERKRKPSDKVNFKKRVPLSSLRDGRSIKRRSPEQVNWKKRTSTPSLQCTPQIKRNPRGCRSREGMTTKRELSTAGSRRRQGEEPATTSKEIRAKTYNLRSRADSRRAGVSSPAEGAFFLKVR
ncbi:hypothetical protein TNCV_2508721 [Trichonephila clavipes]|nr:hypothetical protein TNCV_2508721 [Trichonephila clavipes]